MRALDKWHRLARPWRAASIAALFWVMLLITSCGQAKAPTLMVTPSAISVSVDASRSPALELSGGLHAYVTPAPTDEGSSISLTLDQLIDVDTGRSLPADRLLVGIDTLRPMPVTGEARLSLSGHGPTKIRVGVQPQLFDSPGVYEGELSLSLSGDHAAIPGNVLVQIAVLPWTAIRLVSPSLLVTSDSILEPNALMSSGEQRAVQVAGNRGWQLVAQAPAGLQPQAGPSTSSIANDLRVRVLPNEWVQPIVAGFTMLTESPTVLATGRATGDCAGGWASVTLELRLPYGHDQAAGVYSGDLRFSVLPN